MAYSDYKYTDDDIYLPNTIWGEIKFIFFMLKYLLTHPNERKKELSNLHRQIAIYIFCIKNN